jgi:hypothetical protein
LPSVGQVIRPGQALFKVGGEPVILMNGTTPAYRDLTPADGPGQDILELNRNLVELGINPEGIVVDDTWQSATTAAVDVLQASLGQSETGSLTLGQVVFLPGDQLISTVDAKLGSTGGSSNGTNASDPAPAVRSEFVSLEKPAAPRSRPAHHKHGNQLKTLEALTALLKAELAERSAAKGSPSSSGHPSSPSHPGKPSSSSSGSPRSSGSPSSSSSSNGGGGGGASASEILQTTSTQLIVTVDLDASKQSEAKVGERVTVQLPSGNTVNARITAVSPVADSSSNNNNNGNGNGNSNNNSNNNNNGSGGSGSTIPVTIALSGHRSGAGLDQAAVSVSFAQARASNVLSVPVTALLATAGGGYAVQEAAAPHRLIPVTTGLFAAGDVQISGAGIYPGLQVTDSQG